MSDSIYLIYNQIFDDNYKKGPELSILEFVTTPQVKAQVVLSSRRYLGPGRKVILSDDRRMERC